MMRTIAIIQHVLPELLLSIAGCSGVSPPATTIFLIFLVFEGLLFGIFTAIMFGSQLTAICSDETVSIPGTIKIGKLKTLKKLL